MTPAERVILARWAYERVLRAARLRPNRALWARVIRAARNLRDALDELARSGEREPAR